MVPTESGSGGGDALPSVVLGAELAALRVQVADLRSENARLLRLLDLTPAQARRCWWLAADFDGPAAMLDALAYLKAARAAGAPVALELSRGRPLLSLLVSGPRPEAALPRDPAVREAGDREAGDSGSVGVQAVDFDGEPVAGRGCGRHLVGHVARANVGEVRAKGVRAAQHQRVARRVFVVDHGELGVGGESGESGLRRRGLRSRRRRPGCRMWWVRCEWS